MDIQPFVAFVLAIMTLFAAVLGSVAILNRD